MYFLSLLSTSFFAILVILITALIPETRYDKQGFTLLEFCALFRQLLSTIPSSRSVLRAIWGVRVEG